MGDFFFNLPARKLANYHRGEPLPFLPTFINKKTVMSLFFNQIFFPLIDAGAPVYMYEYQHPAYVFQNKRPSFVGCDHGDELLFVFGYCFGNGHIKVEGTV